MLRSAFVAVAQECSRVHRDEEETFRMLLGVVCVKKTEWYV